MKIKPMLCDKEEGDESDLRRSGNVSEWKYDGGARGIIEKINGVVTIYNRNGVNYTRRMPELVAAAESIKGDFTIDGEICFINPQTHEIEFTPAQRRCATSDPAGIWYLMHEKKISPAFHVLAV